MAELLIDTQGAPAAPASGKLLIYPTTSTLQLTTRDTNGKTLSLPGVRNTSVAAQAYTTTEIYLTGSALAIPAHLLQVGTTLIWDIILTKTAGTAIPVFIVRIGTAGTTSDAAIATFTGFVGPTSATDTAWVRISHIIRTTGASATSQAAIRMNHALASTGFSNLTTAVQQVAGTTFNSTTASLIAGVTFNHSTAGAGNIELVTGELMGI